MAKSNQQKFILSATPFTPLMITRENAGRAGLLLANPNSANNAQIQIFLNEALDWGSGIPLVPNEKYMADFVTPEDAVFVMSDTANAVVVMVEANHA